MERDAFSRLVYFMLKNERGLLEISFNAFRGYFVFFYSYFIRSSNHWAFNIKNGLCDVSDTDLRDGVLDLDECRNCTI